MIKSFKRNEITPNLQERDLFSKQERRIQQRNRKESEVYDKGRPWRAVGR